MQACHNYDSLWKMRCFLSPLNPSIKQKRDSVWTADMRRQPFISNVFLSIPSKLPTCFWNWLIHILDYNVINQSEILFSFFSVLIALLSTCVCLDRKNLTFINDEALLACRWDEKKLNTSTSFTGSLIWLKTLFGLLYRKFWYTNYNNQHSFFLKRVNSRVAMTMTAEEWPSWSVSVRQLPLQTA